MAARTSATPMPVFCIHHGLKVRTGSRIKARVTEDTLFAGYIICVLAECNMQGAAEPNRILDRVEVDCGIKMVIRVRAQWTQCLFRDTIVQH